jgi:hypothetical protein
VLLALAGETSMRGGPDWFVVRPGEAADIEAMVDALRAEGRLPADVVHLWTLVSKVPQVGVVARFERVRDRAFRSLFHLARALGRRGFESKACVHVISNGVQEVAGEGIFAPLAALLLGTCRVAASELPGLRLRNVDLQSRRPRRGSTRSCDASAELVARPRRLRSCAARAAGRPRQRCARPPPDPAGCASVAST